MSEYKYVCGMSCGICHLRISQLNTQKLISDYFAISTSFVFWSNITKYLVTDAVISLGNSLDKNIRSHHPWNPLGMYWKPIKPS